MPDNLTPDQRRRSMSRVKNRDTDLERAVRSALHRRGPRFTKHVTELPGSPDIVFSGARVAVFVDGDFWHGYKFEDWGGGQSSFWQVKIQRSQDRDERNTRDLVALGWIVVRPWQHEIEDDLDACVASVISAVDRSRDMAHPATETGSEKVMIASVAA